MVQKQKDRPERSHVAARPRMQEISHHGNRLTQLRELSSSQLSLTSNISHPSHASQGFQYQNRRTRPKATHITGTSRSDKIRGAPEPSRDIFVYRVAKGTSEKDIQEYMADNNVNVRSIERVSLDVAKFSSFNVELKKSDLNRALKTEFWPTSVCVRKYFKTRINNGD